METTHIDENKLEAIVNISDFTDEADTYQMTHSDTGWMAELLKEVEADFFDEDLPKGEGTLFTEVNLVRLVNNIYGEHLVVRGAITGQYHAACVRCLEPSFQEFETEFKAAFINSRFEKDPEYEELSHIFADGEDVELNFHNKGKADLKDLLKEQIYLVIEPLPLHKEDCKGLCGVCGSNLNKVDCGHGNALQ